MSFKEPVIIENTLAVKSLFENNTNNDFHHHKDTKAPRFTKLCCLFSALCVFLVTWSLSGKIIAVKYFIEF
jgi:hypothetical protein